MNKLMNALICFLFVSLSAYGGCWNVTNVYGVTHTHCIAGPRNYPDAGVPGAVTWRSWQWHQHCWINMNGVEVCN
ncbi:MAG: hypothetical protein A3E87_04595 [Gammaproteobacteria bacterium RIFCSPHIGHO2_12_FULL_35_23]|nr:MAG: hypothetical protein A3E87_04595 [Gammaproteobacteria bacterium RIFCSPHIGHO2_12_FULL_35_23]